jgi:hypothetical protein
LTPNLYAVVLSMTSSEMRGNALWIAGASVPQAAIDTDAPPAGAIGARSAVGEHRADAHF